MIVNRLMFITKLLLFLIKNSMNDRVDIEIQL